MTERELRRLSRADLLEMLIEQGTELEDLRGKYAAAMEKLEKREVNAEQVGTLAEAALRFNGVFDAADAAAQEYMEAVRARTEAQKNLCEQLERESREAAEKLERESREAAEQLKQETQRSCSKLEEETKVRCAEMTAKAKAESEEYWNQISGRLDVYCEQYNGIRELLAVVMEKQTKQ